MTELRITRNLLRGTLPDLSALTNLRVLSLSNNRLSGPIPDLSALTNLRVLSLHGNRLSGPVPDLSVFSNLKTLYLHNNALSGPIPELGALAELRWLDLSYNALSGPIPDLSALAELGWLDLAYNALSGPVPDLGALADLWWLDLAYNALSGPVPDLGALANLRRLDLAGNELTGPIPDLSALAVVTWLDLRGNELSGPIPELSALARLTTLNLSYNELSGPLPDLGALTSLRQLYLFNNELSGPVLDLHVLTSLEYLELGNNQLSGPLPDLGALVNLRSLDLAGNRFCLPAGRSLSHAHGPVENHLKSLDLPACSAADLAAFPPAPQNLRAVPAGDRVALTWDAAAHAAGYELQVWDSLDRIWEPVAGGPLTGTGYSHPVLRDGRNYYYQVRARNAAGVHGPWSPRAQAIVVPQRFPPPPPSLGLNLFYQKYLEVGGVVVTAPSEVSDAKLAQVREIVTAMYAGRPAFFADLSANYIRIVIFKRNAAGEGIVQLPELSHLEGDNRGLAFSTATGWAAVAAQEDENCYVLIHEFAHTLQFALEDQPGGHAFKARVRALYDAALSAGLWQGAYASTNVREYWAETVTFWFLESVYIPDNVIDSSLEDFDGVKLEDYDSDIAELIAETFGAGAYVPSYCKP